MNLLLACLILLACSSKESDPVFELELLSASRVSDFQGAELESPVQARIVDQEGNPQAGIEISAAIIAGDGGIESMSTQSNDHGIVEINWRLGQEVLQTLALWIKVRPEARVEVSAQTKYVYQQPTQDQDGWEIGNLDFLSESGREQLLNGIDVLRRGDFPEVHSVLVIHKGKLVLESYYSGKDSNGNFIEWDRFKRHEIQSASKSYRSMLLGIAIEQGFIQNEHELLYTFFPEIEDTQDAELKKTITLDHVLTMSSGFEWDEWNFPFGHASNTLSQMYSKPLSQQTPFVLGLPMRDEPGTVFVYSTGTSRMISDIVEKAIDTDVVTFIQTYYSSVVEDFSPSGKYGAQMTPREMAKWGQVYLNKGTWKGQRIVSESWVEKSKTKRFDVNGRGYGFQWWINTYSTPNNSYNSYNAGGNGGQYVMIFEELDMVVVFTGGNFGLSRMSDVLNRWMVDYLLTAFGK